MSPQFEVTLNMPRKGSAMIMGLYCPAQSSHVYESGWECTAPLLILGLLDFGSSFFFSLLLQPTEMRKWYG